VLIIRKEQQQALQEDVNRRHFPALVDEVMARLASDGLLDDDGGRGSPMVQAQVVGAIRRGQAAGISSEDGLTQFVSYRFLIDPHWESLPAVKAALAAPVSGEDERLAAVHLAIVEG